MAITHRTRQGQWRACANPDTCKLPIHIPLAPEEVEQLTQEMLWPLLELVDPPDYIRGGVRYWLDSNSLYHRDYDLPAVVHPFGTVEWYKHGELHRKRGKPAAVGVSGDRHWYVNGKPKRPGGQPAITMPNGYEDWFRFGTLHRWLPRPATVLPNGRKEWWLFGYRLRVKDEQGIVPIRHGNPFRRANRFKLKYPGPHGIDPIQLWSKRSPRTEVDGKPCTHRTLDGSWASCTDTSCQLLFHTDLTLTEAEQIPEPTFEDIANVVDQSDRGRRGYGDGDYRKWEKSGVLHRDYDLPAAIYGDGTREWWQHGELHRGLSKPARVKADGIREWYQHGQLLRTNDPDASHVTPPPPPIISLPLTQTAEAPQVAAPAKPTIPTGPQTHRTHDGGWETCPNPVDCASPIHLDMSIEEAKQLPESSIEQLAYALDPPTKTRSGPNNLGADWWKNELGLSHRDWGLPAIIYPDDGLQPEHGLRVWMKNGRQHRDHGLPAEVWSNGYMEWWESGFCLGSNGLEHPRGSSSRVSHIYQPGSKAPARNTASEIELSPLPHAQYWS